jgi:hypothetical protein
MQRLPVREDDHAEAPRCAAGARACSWNRHGFKHFPAKGVTRDDTRHGPAKYLPDLDAAQIQAIETGTVRGPGAHSGAPPGKTEYIRDVGQVIGWDSGQDAHLSFAECTGAQGARAFHGRPILETAKNTRRLLAMVER